MELHGKSREELWELVKSLKLKPAKNISDENLKALVEREAIRHTLKIEEEVRAELQAKSKMRQDIAEIKATAQLANITIEIPVTPTLTDVIRLKKELGIRTKEPKPSPETLAIEASKKVYAVFHPQEGDDADMKCIPGGKYHFHFWADRIHIIPEWLVGWMRKFVTVPIYEHKKDPVTGGTISVRTGSRSRVLWEVIGDAPANALFGVVLDERILEKLTQSV